MVAYPAANVTDGENVSLSTQKLSIGYQQRQVIDALDLVLPSEKVSVLIGSNGCGKSTLLKAMARLLTPQSGTVILDGMDIHTSNTAQIARKMAILPQTPVAPEGVTVRQLVSLGRFPYQNWLRQWSKDDEQQVDEALRLTGTEALQFRPVDALSGGQRQRVWIAMILAQSTPTLLLDEPTTYLDLAHQIERYARRQRRWQRICQPPWRTNAAQTREDKQGCPVPAIPYRQLVVQRCEKQYGF
jgi:iron complex transport system ATP-binding protein